MDTVAWLAEGDHWTGSSGIGRRSLEHVVVTACAVLASASIAVPIGLVVGHFRRGRAFAVGVSGAARAVPTLGVVTLAGLAMGIGVGAPLLALVVLAVPSILAASYAGVENVDPGVTYAARAMGMTHWQVIRRIEIPLAAPVVIGGLRAAALQVVSTATLAAYTADVGLGRFLFTGLKSRDYPQMLAGAVVVTALALLVEVAFAAGQRAAHRHTRLDDPQPHLAEMHPPPRKALP